MSNIDKQALIAKIKKQTESYDTVVLREDEANALLDELEAAEKRYAEMTTYRDNAAKKVVKLRTELTAAEKRIAELELKDQHSERQSVIDALATAGESWSDIEEYMQKWDAERAAVAGKGEAS